MKVSIALPTSYMRDGEYLFRRCLDSLWLQTYQDFEIVVTDNSDNDVIENICKEYGGISYYRNPIKGMAQNTNDAIKRSKGEIIKILYMDDLLATNRSLESIVRHFRGGWLVTGCVHIQSDTFGEVGEHYNPYYPSYSSDIFTGNNTIGSPSVLTIANKNPIMFDENMTWLLDCDYYRRLYDLFGPPTILKEICTIIGIHDDQATNTMGEARKLEEFEYINKKYNE